VILIKERMQSYAIVNDPTDPELNNEVVELKELPYMPKWYGVVNTTYIIPRSQIVIMSASYEYLYKIKILL
jgi:hypothetical protein